MPPTPAAGGQKIMAPGRMDRLMETLDHALRRGEVDPALLSDLGWDVPQARQFVQAYERAVTAAVTRRPQRTALPARTTEREAGRDDVPEVLRADEAEGDRGALDASSRLAESNASGLMEVGRQRAPERYRPIVEAYYRSLGSRPAE
jgi:hypothetical protein